MGKEIKISELRDDIELDQLPEGTVIVLDEDDPATEDGFWEKQKKEVLHE